MPGVDERVRSVHGQPIEELGGALPVESHDLDARARAGARKPHPPRPGRRWARAGRAGCRPGTAGRRPGPSPRGAPPCAGWPRRPSAGPRARPSAVRSASTPGRGATIASHWAKAVSRVLASSSPDAPDRPADSSSASRTERHGQRGGAPSSCEQRPTATVNPRSAARVGQVARPAGTCRCRAPPRPGRRRSGRPTPRRASRRERRVRRRGRPARRPTWVCARRAAQPGRPPGPGRPRCARSPATAGGQPTPVPEPWAGVDPELLGERRADGAQRLQRVGLSPGAGQGQGVGGPERLAQRVARDRGLGGRQHAGVVADREQAEEARLLGATPQLLERGPLGLHVRVVGQVGVRLPRPRRECGVEPVDGPRRRPRASASRLPARSRTGTSAGRAPGRSPVPRRRRRVRRPTAAAPAARSRGRWSR